MRIRWRGLELPTTVELDTTVSTETYGRLIIEPFERGFGTTIGNSLRRILLSCLEGSAVTSIKVKGASHEFTSISGLLEDVSDIILNIKSLVVRLDSDEPKKMLIEKNTSGVVTAADIEADPAVTIVNPDHVIATLTEDIDFSMEMTVERGRGYVPAHNDAESDQEIGEISVDAIYSPVVRVRYKTEETRVGQRINYDRLIMEIWTDGTISPEMALVESAKILRKHLGTFVNYFQVGTDVAEQQVEEEEVQVQEEVPDENLHEKLALPLADLELSVRAGNCLEIAKFETIGQLVAMDENSLLAMRSFGKTSLREVRRKLADLGLSLGMDVPEEE